MPRTNFFQGLETLQINGIIKMTLSLSNDRVWTGSILVMDPEVKDAAVSQIIPLNFQGTSDELAEGFFDGLKVPITRPKVLFTNLRAHEKSVDDAQKAATAGQQKAAKASGKTGTPPIPPRYLELMKKVEELIAKKRYGEAIAAMPSAEKYPQQKAMIEAKMAELKKLHGGFSTLFDQPADSPTSTAATTETAEPDDPDPDPTEEDPEEPDPEGLEEEEQPEDEE